jgi:hypothetical protein
VAEKGWSQRDRELFTTDRCAGTTTSVKDETIDVWYSGKHRAFGVTVQMITRPDGSSIRTDEDNTPKV